jgi:hypothetical protein
MEHPEFDDELPEDNLDIPDEWYAADIENIHDPELRTREIEAAEKIREWEQDLDAKLDAGEISDYQYWSEYQFEIGPQKVRLATRTALESVGLSYDMLGDVVEDLDKVVADDQKFWEQKEELKRSIGLMGPDAAQELADKRLAEEKLSEELNQMISRQVRLNQE